jgi:hypothetical protein
MEILNRFSELRSQQLALAMIAFFLQFDFNLIKEYRLLIFGFEGALSEATLVLNLTIESGIWVQVLGLKIV